MYSFACLASELHIYVKIRPPWPSCIKWCKLSCNKEPKHCMLTICIHFSSSLESTFLGLKSFHRSTSAQLAMHLKIFSLWLSQSHWFAESPGFLFFAFLQGSLVNGAVSHGTPPWKIPNAVMHFDFGVSEYRASIGCRMQPCNSGCLTWITSPSCVGWLEVQSF